MADDDHFSGESDGSPGDMAAELTALETQEGWRVEGTAGRVHYRGETDRYSIEFYAPSCCTIYWKVPPAESEHETAVPVARRTVPGPLRERVREDFAAAGIDPDVEKREI